MSRLEKLLLALAVVLGLVIQFEAYFDMRQGYLNPPRNTLADWTGEP